MSRAILLLLYVLLHSIIAALNVWTHFNLTHYYQPTMVNGKPVSGEDYKWMVSLRYESPQFNFAENPSVRFFFRFCGGSLISTDPITILTAAHCLEIFTYDSTAKTIRDEDGKMVDLYVDLGRTKGPHLNNNYDESADTFVTLEIPNLDSVYIHPEWKSGIVREGNDIAVIIIHDGQRLPNNYPFVSIPNQMSNFGECCDEGDQLIAIGYGASEDKDEGGVPTDTLQRITMTYHRSSGNKQIAAIGNRENDQDVCSGDSGGPLFRILNDGTIEVVGITSYSIGHGNGDFCNSEHPNAEPSYFTSTAHFTDWIQKIIDPTPKIISTNSPTVKPTVRPTLRPTVRPTVVTSLAPIKAPTYVPTNAPTVKPTLRPTMRPTVVTSLSPTNVPTNAPAVKPIVKPTVRPTVATSLAPIKAPKVLPAAAPTVAPTVRPTVITSLSPIKAPTVSAANDSVVDPTTTIIPLEESSGWNLQPLKLIGIILGSLVLTRILLWSVCHWLRQTEHQNLAQNSEEIPVIDEHLMAQYEI